MNIPGINAGDISRYRSELMGTAILFVILFHVGLDRYDIFYGLKRCGNIGVDMFLFVSGVGMWFAMAKNHSLSRFFRHRYLRVYPTWFLLACLFYIPDYLGPRAYSVSLTDLVGDIAVNWDFWLYDELTFWYVPAVMMLYFFVPAYVRRIKRSAVWRWLPVLMIVWCVAVQWVRPPHKSVGHIETFWHRVPLFFIGINAGRAVMEQRRSDAHATCMALLTLVSTAALCIYLEQMRHGHFPLFVERLVYIPLCCSLTVLLCMVFAHTPRWLNTSLRFLGGISLEIYLIHLHFVLCRVEPLGWSYWPTFLLTLVVSVAIAWVVRQLTTRAVSYIK